jgi:hypothetical protein
MANLRKIGGEYLQVYHLLPAPIVVHRDRHRDVLSVGIEGDPCTAGPRIFSGLFPRLVSQLIDAGADVA